VIGGGGGGRGEGGGDCDSRPVLLRLVLGNPGAIISCSNRFACPPVSFPAALAAPPNGLMRLAGVCIQWYEEALVA